MRAPSAKSLFLAVAAAACSFAAAGVDTRLVDAAKNQDQAAVQTLLKEHLNVNAVDAEGMTALLWAAHRDDVDVAKLLLRAGANPRIANRYGVTPLFEAATVGDAALIHALIDAGADPNATLPEGETALMPATRTGNMEAVKLLLDRGAKVNAHENTNGESALMFAAAENHAAVAELLIAHGADVNARSINFGLVDRPTIRGGISYYYVNGGLTPLLFAARQDAIETAKVLIKAGADVNLPDADLGLTPMLVAIDNGHYDFAAFMVDQGAELNDGSLYLTVDMRNMNKTPNRPPPPQTGNVSSTDFMKILLDHGANPNGELTKRLPARETGAAGTGLALGPTGATALIRAAKAVDLPAMRVLLDKGADAGRPMNDKTTPLISVLAGAGRGRGGVELTGAGEASIVEAVKMLLDHGADPNAVGNGGTTVSHLAAQRGLNQVLQTLAENGARFDLKNKDGKTALDLAAGRENTEALLRKLIANPPAQKISKTL